MEQQLLRNSKWLVILGGGAAAAHEWLVTSPWCHRSAISWELLIIARGVKVSCLVSSAGAGSKVGWAFGLGLDRLAMRLYQIPHIRLLWSDDDRFINQFKVTDPNTPITFKVSTNFYTLLIINRCSFTHSISNVVFCWRHVDVYFRHSATSLPMWTTSHSGCQTHTMPMTFMTWCVTCKVTS